MRGGKDSRSLLTFYKSRAPAKLRSRFDRCDTVIYKADHNILVQS